MLGLLFVHQQPASAWKVAASQLSSGWCSMGGGTWDMPPSEAYQLPGKYASCVAQTSAHSFPNIHFLQGSIQSINVTVTRQQGDL